MFDSTKTFGYAFIASGLMIGFATLYYGRGMLGLFAAGFFVLNGVALVRQAGLDELADQDPSDVK